MGLFWTKDPRSVQSAWVLVIFGCGHTCLGESLTTALVEVKFNSLTLAALSFNAAKGLLVFSIFPLPRLREIEFSLNIAYRRIVGRNPNRIGASDKNVKYGRFYLNNSKFYLFSFFTLTREMLRLQFWSNFFFSS